jgi:hypothetical protein
VAEHVRLHADIGAPKARLERLTAVGASAALPGRALRVGGSVGTGLYRDFERTPWRPRGYAAWRGGPADERRSANKPPAQASAGSLEEPSICSSCPSYKEAWIFNAASRTPGLFQHAIRSCRQSCPWPMSLSTFVVRVDLSVYS